MSNFSFQKRKLSLEDQYQSARSARRDRELEDIKKRFDKDIQRFKSLPKAVKKFLIEEEEKKLEVNWWPALRRKA